MKTVLTLLGLGLAVAASSASAQAAPDAGALYRQHCRSCHGATGVPTQRMLTMYENLVPLDSAFLAQRSDDSLVAVVRDGVGRDMKTFKDKLTAEEMLAVALYLRTLPARTSP